MGATPVLANAGLSSSANAATFGMLSNEFNTTPTFESAPGKTKFQTLQDAYRSSTTPVSLGDFINSAEKKCVIADAHRQDEIGITLVTVHCEKVLSPAKPAYDIEAIPARNIPAGPGPLLPARHEDAIPARHVPATPEMCDISGENKLLMGGDWIKTITPEKLAIFSNRQTSTDFVIEIAENDLGIYSDIGDNVRISMRKYSNTFPFLVESKKGIVYSGYCY